MISERVQLLALELKRARQALVVIAALVVVAALLLLTAWFVLWGAIVAALIAAGLAWGWAVLIVLLVNIGGAVGALLYASSLGHFLALPATMRHLTISVHNPGKAHAAPFTDVSRATTSTATTTNTATTASATTSAAPGASSQSPVSSFAAGTGPAAGPAAKRPAP